MTRRLVYTAMFGNYDLILPPIRPTKCCDFLIVTDDNNLSVKGWNTVTVDISKFATSKHANLFYRATIFNTLPGYNYALYLDANIRILGPLDTLFEEFESSGADIGVYRHPLRDSVAEEIEYCLTISKKVKAGPDLKAEIAYQQDQQFPDNVGLIETGVFFQNHKSQKFKDTMTLWNENFQKFGTRDQFGLPFAIWKINPKLNRHPLSFRELNLYFGLYPHRASADTHPLYTYIVARSYDHPFYKIMKKLWEAKWQITRTWRNNHAKGSE